MSRVDPATSAATPTAAEVRSAAERILSYLSEVDPEPTAPVDAIMGFGMFDLTLPRFCAGLFERGAGRRIIFTGGLGAGTGDLGGPEADVWRAELRRTHPKIGDSDVFVENRSTNTAENIRFTAELLERSHPNLALGKGLRRAIVVASPSRLRRVRLTLRKLVPELTVYRMLPAVSFEAERALYSRQGIDYHEHLVGELDRLAAYPGRGWIAPEVMPSEIAAAGEIVRSALPSEKKKG